MKRIKFNPDAMQHIYNRSADCGVIFYSVEDRLVYYTIAATTAKKYGIVVCAASIMFTHIHQSCRAQTYELLSKYLQDLDSIFARAYNYEHGLEGQLFRKHPGKSQKQSWKAIKTNLIYVYNNHVEKKICQRAIQERWAFLAYAFSDHPFSDPVVNPSKAIRKALSLVDRRIKNSKSIRYLDLKRIFPTLDPIETEQFIDYVISRYALISFNESAKYFKDIESMVIAIDSNEGGEFNIKEDFYNSPDTPFVQLVSFCKANGISDALKLSDYQKEKCIRYLQRHMSISNFHLIRFFHPKT